MNEKKIVYDVDELNEEDGESKIFAMMGKVTLTVPETVPATIEVTARGRWSRRTDGDSIVRSDFTAETFRDAIDVVRARYVINNGGHLINVTANQSNVEIKKSN